MFNFLNRITLSARIALLMALIILSFSGLFIMAHAYLREALYERQIEETKHLVQSAHALLKHFAKEVEQGNRGLVETQKIALAYISDLHYSKDGYFWINDHAGRMLTHPLKSFIGTNMLDKLDGRGDKFIQNMIQIALQNNEGATSYYWPPQNPQKKLSYVINFPEWEWVIGSGIFTNDIEKELNTIFFKLSLLATGCLALILFFTISLGRTITAPIKKINNALQKIAAGYLDQDYNLDLNRKDEVGEMAQTVKVFADHSRQVAKMDKEKAALEKTKSEFVSVVSHELRTPLTSIRGSLGLVIGTMSKELPEKTLKLITMAHDNSERLMTLINDLLDLDKAAAGEMEIEMKEEALHPLLQMSADNNEGYAKKFSVRILYEPIDDKIKISIDRSRLNQVLNNLISNAAKFSPAGGAVIIKAEKKETHIRINIIDHGLGIPKDFQANIFGKFAQADSSSTRKKNGTGLGLNISKTLVEAMNGRIGFNSKDGFGTTFWVEFPNLNIKEETT